MAPSGGLVLSNPRWLPAATAAEPIGLLPQISYTAQAAAKQTNGALELVATAEGQVYVRVAVSTSLEGHSFYKTLDDFVLTFDKTGKVSRAIHQEAFELYKQAKWAELEHLFKKYSLSDGWPPANGGYNITEIRLSKGMRLDRYAKTILNEKAFKDGDVPELGGQYASPMNRGKQNFEVRALEGSIIDYDLYFEIELLDDLPFKALEADIIPWHGKVGGGKQIYIEIPADPLTGFSYTWNQMETDGLIKLTVKESPSGKFKILSGNKLNRKK